MIQVCIPVTGRNFLLLDRIQRGSVAHSASYPMDAAVIFWSLSGLDMKKTRNLDLETGFRIRAAKPRFLLICLHVMVFN
jgi:hypothetical protein